MGLSVDTVVRKIQDGTFTTKIKSGNPENLIKNNSVNKV